MSSLFFPKWQSDDTEYSNSLFVFCFFYCNRLNTNQASSQFEEEDYIRNYELLINVLFFPLKCYLT